MSTSDLYLIYKKVPDGILNIGMVGVPDLLFGVIYIKNSLSWSLYDQ